MKKTVIFFLIIIIFLFQGCSNSTYKQDILKEELRGEVNTTTTPASRKAGTEIIEVSAENFKISKSIVPDGEIIKNVKIFGATLEEVILLLSEATNQNIIFQSHSGNTYNNVNNNTNNTTNNNNIANNTNIENEIQEPKIYISSSNIGFGRFLKKTVGDIVSIGYEDSTYYLGYNKTVTIKIPSIKGMSDSITSTMRSLGALNSSYDPISSTISFSAKEKEYQDIMNYLKILRNNLYVIEYSISIYNVILKDNYSLGINWDVVAKNTGDAISLAASTAASAGLAVTGAPSVSVGAILNNDNYSANSMINALSEFGQVESVQRPTLIGLAGTDVTLTDGTQEQYIQTLTAISNGLNGIQTSTTNATALSGIQITLNSNIMDGTVLTDIDLHIQDIVGYTDFEAGGVKYSQPKTLTKTIKSSMRVQPGVPIVISGLFRTTKDRGFKGIPGMENSAARVIGGSEYTGVSKSEMVIIVTPRVIKYVMK